LIAMSTAAIAPVHRRQIGVADLDAVADLLAEGFEIRSRDYWLKGFDVLARRPSPEGYPRFGFMLDCGGAPVGVILLIFSRTDNAPAGPVRCNLSSWYVREGFRGYAPLLTAAALAFKEVTYINSSAAGYTWATIQTQGYAAYGKGQFVSVPCVSPRGLGARVRSVGSDADGADDPMIDLLAAHARAGCLSLICEADDGAHPFVFARWRLQSRLKMMRLLYCRDTADYVRCAGPVGRFLLRRGVAAVACDAVAPIPGLVGKYYDGAEPKFFKGPAAPRLNDLAFTESVIFGV
jgi:hypothetical protein